MPAYKYCVVPNCKNTTVTSPNKLFFCLPREKRMRRIWCLAMKRDKKKIMNLSPTTSLYCCEDHFTLEEDMLNYWQYKLAGSVQKFRLKKGVIPHAFDCQNKSPRKRLTGEKRRRFKIIQEAKSEFYASTSETIEHESLSQTMECDVPRRSIGLQIFGEPVFGAQVNSPRKVKSKGVQIITKALCRSIGIIAKPEHIFPLKTVKKSTAA